MKVLRTGGLKAAGYVFVVAATLVGHGPLVAGELQPAGQDLLYVCVQDDAKVAIVDMVSKTVLRKQNHFCKMLAREMRFLFLY